jgi:hypothetical protein
MKKLGGIIDFELAKEQGEKDNKKEFKLVNDNVTSSTVFLSN